NDFHLHLKKYESHRVCNCGACRTANNLSVKFVAHYGEITMSSIRQYKKLFGKEVIVAHRLLKNDIEQHEYSLFTDDLMAASKSWTTMEETWSPLERSEKVYDSGPIGFTYLAMDPLLGQLPAIEHINFDYSGPKSIVLETEAVINAPMHIVFDVVADVTWRPKWIPGIGPEVTDVNSKLTQSGQTHRCIVNEPRIIGHDYHIDQDVICFSETPEKKTHGVLYKLHRLSDGRTRIQATLWIPRNPMKAIMFKMMMKKKMMGMFDQSWSNLKFYCEELATRGENHSFTLMLQPEPEHVRA
ncbi:MAG: DUF2652 domain-containing protein, partial [Saprospiraceae bacterium]